MSQRKYKLIIGGSGFVGSFLINKLNDFSVINFDKNPSPFFNKYTIIGNILDIENFENIFLNVDSVVLLAAEHRDDVTPASKYYDVNVNGTKNVLKKMDKFKVNNLIFTSSVAVFGLNKSNPDENHEVDPFNDYGKSKWQAELAIKDWYDKNPDKKSVTIIRPTVIFGERNRGNVYNLFKQISSGKFIMIGDGQNKKSMAYVGNIVEFIKHKLEKQEKGIHIYNYADGPDYTMNDLISVVKNKMNTSIPNIKIPYWLGLIVGYLFDFLAFVFKRKFSISSIRVKKFCATTQFNSKKVKLSFKAPTSLKKGIEITLEKEFINKNNDNVVFYSE